jgi:hypothetical protein
MFYAIISLSMVRRSLSLSLNFQVTWFQRRATVST